MAEEHIGRAWSHPKTGETRYYIDVEKAAEYGGLEVERYNTGNICWSQLDGKKVSHAEANRILSDVYKVYYTEDGAVHIQPSGYNGLRYENFWDAAKKSIEDAVKGEFEVGE